jgi:hypothetical protein
MFQNDFKNQNYIRRETYAQISCMQYSLSLDLQTTQTMQAVYHCSSLTTLPYTVSQQLGQQVSLESKVLQTVGLLRTGSVEHVLKPILTINYGSQKK